MTRLARVTRMRALRLAIVNTLTRLYHDRVHPAPLSMVILLRWWRQTNVFRAELWWHILLSANYPVKVQENKSLIWAPTCAQVPFFVHPCGLGNSQWQLFRLLRLYVSRRGKRSVLGVLFPPRFAHSFTFLYVFFLRLEKLECKDSSCLLSCSQHDTRLWGAARHSGVLQLNRRLWCPKIRRLCGLTARCPAVHVVVCIGSLGRGTSNTPTHHRLHYSVLP